VLYFYLGDRNHSDQIPCLINNLRPATAMEQSVAIPIITIGTVIFGWLVFLTKRIYANEQSIKENNINDQRVNSELQRIYNILEKFEHKMETSIDKLDKKMELRLDKMELMFERRRRKEN